MEVTELQRAEPQSSPQGSDIKTLERSLQHVIKMGFLTLINNDDAEGLEDALLVERSSELKLLNKKSKKKNQANGIKEENDFFVLGRRILHYACAADSVECCKLLLTPQNFPRIRIDAVEETDHRSALHFACLHHSRRCAEVLLKQGANASLKNKQLMLPMEEFFLNPQLHVEWDLTTPAAEIVEHVGKKDLSILRLLESKCKDQLISVAFKLAKGLKVVPLVALLHVARNSIVNSVAKNSEEEEPGGTLVDFLLGKALESRPGNLLERQSEKASKCRKVKVEGEGEAWPGEASSMYRKTFYEGEGTTLDFRKSLGDRPGSASETKLKKDLGDYAETATEIKRRKDLNEWEEINSKYSLKSGEVESGDGECNKRLSASSIGVESERPGLQERGLSPVGCEDPEKACNVARKLLECVLLFKPRLSSHSQSPFPPPLLRAAQMSDDGLVELFLDTGAPINETDADGNTALHWALRQGTPVNKRSVNCKMVQKLLNAGANVLVGNKLGATPAHTAAGHGHFEALSLLLQKESACVNVMAATKETPLHYSVKNNHILCTALLLKHGANRNVSSLRNQKPYQLAPSAEMKLLMSLEEKVVHERSLDELMVLCAGQQSLPLSQDHVPTSTFILTETSPGASCYASSEFSSHAAALFQPLSQAHPGYNRLTPHHLQSHLLIQPETLSKSPPTCITQFLPVPSSQSLKKPAPQNHMTSLVRLQSLPLPTSSNLNEPSASYSWQSAYQGGSQLLMANGLQSSTGEGDMLNKSNVSLPAYKTVLCRFFGTNGGCGWGSKCHFAHSEEELQLGQQYLKMLASKIEGGTGIPVTTETNFKTKLCTHYEKMKICPHNGKCKFAHGEAELRLASASCSTGSSVRLCPRPSTASSLGSCCSEDGEEMNSKKIFVGGLPPYITSEDLWEFFEGEFGKVVDAMVIYGNDDEGNMRSRGFGFVFFEKLKDADEAVRRHFLPIRGKKVEVKKAMSRFDSQSEYEKGKPAFSSEISSPTGSLSPALLSSGSNIGMIADGMLLSASPSKGHHQGWSLPSLSVETVQLPLNAPQDTNKPIEALPQTVPPLQPQNKIVERSQSREDFVCHGNGELIYDNSRPASRKTHHQSQIGILPDSNFLMKNPSTTSYSLYLNSPLEDSMYISNSSSTLHLNLSSPVNTPSNNLFSQYSNGCSSSLFSSAPMSTPQRSSAADQSDDNDEELSQLLELLQVGKCNSSAQSSYTTSSSRNQQLQVSSANIQFRSSDRGSLPGASMTNSQREAFLVSSQDSPQFIPYPDAHFNPAMERETSGLGFLNGFDNYPQSAVGIRQHGDASTFSGYGGLLPGTNGYNEFSKVPWGGRGTSEVQALGFQTDTRTDRVRPVPFDAHSSNTHSSLLPTYNNSAQAPQYEAGCFSRFGISG